MWFDLDVKMVNRFLKNAMLLATLLCTFLTEKSDFVTKMKVESTMIVTTIVSYIFPGPCWEISRNLIKRTVSCDVKNIRGNLVQVQLLVFRCHKNSTNINRWNEGTWAELNNWLEQNRPGNVWRVFCLADIEQLTFLLSKCVWVTASG